MPRRPIIEQEVRSWLAADAFLFAQRLIWSCATHLGVRVSPGIGDEQRNGAGRKFRGLVEDTKAVPGGIGNATSLLNIDRATIILQGQVCSAKLSSHPHGHQGWAAPPPGPTDGSAPQVGE